MSTADFLLNLDRQIGEFIDTVNTTETKTANERRLMMLKVTFAGIYYNIIQFYFRDTGISTDQNVMTTSEIQVVIDKLNNIMNTYLSVDL